MRLKTLIGAATLTSILALGGCEEKKETAPEAKPAPTQEAAPAAEKTKEKAEEPAPEEKSEDQVKTKIDINKNGVGLEFEKTE